MNESIKHLEEKIAYLERHVLEQDKAMLELAGDIGRLRKEMQKLRERNAASGGVSEGDGGAASPAEDRPPHY